MDAGLPLEVSAVSSSLRNWAQSWLLWLVSCLLLSTTFASTLSTWLCQYEPARGECFKSLQIITHSHVNINKVLLFLKLAIKACILTLGEILIDYAKQKSMMDE